MTMSDETLQDANLVLSSGEVVAVKVTAFPDNPELVQCTRYGPAEGRFFVADSPVIGYGTNALSYHEASVYDAATS